MLYFKIYFIIKITFFCGHYLLFCLTFLVLTKHITIHNEFHSKKYICFLFLIIFSFYSGTTKPCKGEVQKKYFLPYFFSLVIESYKKNQVFSPPHLMNFAWISGPFWLFNWWAIWPSDMYIFSNVALISGLKHKYFNSQFCILPSQI